jgi:hypothetical protein
MFINCAAVIASQAMPKYPVMPLLIAGVALIFPAALLAGVLSPMAGYIIMGVGCLCGLVGLLLLQRTGQR